MWTETHSVGESCGYEHIRPNGNMRRRMYLAALAILRGRGIAAASGCSHLPMLYAMCPGHSLTIICRTNDGTAYDIFSSLRGALPALFLPHGVSHDLPEEDEHLHLVRRRRPRVRHVPVSPHACRMDPVWGTDQKRQRARLCRRWKDAKAKGWATVRRRR